MGWYNLKLNIGCGKEIKEGYINIDREFYPGVNICMDLNIDPLPFKENSINEIYISHVIEHLIDPYMFIFNVIKYLKKKD